MKISWIVVASSFLVTLLTSVLILTLSDDFGYKFYTFFEGEKFPSKDNQVFIWLLIYIILLAIGSIAAAFVSLCNFINIEKYNRIMNYAFIFLGVLLLIFGVFLIVAGSNAQSSDKEAVISLSLLSIFLPITLTSIGLMSLINFKSKN
ncbi:hypothetical protein [Spiroplasma turonicum]|uniref:Transmembrane protein n=1 Tax=Spiroplasma turonicum TaxID=216946 RepID=A0A0K1P5X1_9MOLU|nr:hypothetical protein [Spiroplasma turonicum]AKU79713.1 hypothetical protein STURON_00467 [Spiroplasma turonicum]ALX70731.1 hypothetical protein STURO_v1c04650 [Spiroplasma turonicum]